MENNKWNQGKLPKEIRLHMIDKSEFYDNPKVYQYGFYDGYQKALDTEKSKEMLEMLLELEAEAMITPSFTSERLLRLKQLIKSATEL